MDAQYSVLALDAMGQFSHPAQRPSPLVGALIVVALPVVGVVSSDVLLTLLVAGCSLAVGVAGKPPGSTPNMRG